MLSYELREQVVKYIQQDISIDQLEEWYVPRLDFYLAFPNSDDAEMIAEIELALAEMADGSIDEVEARNSLQEILDQLGNTVVAPLAAGGYVSSTVTGTQSEPPVRPIGRNSYEFSSASR